MDIEAMREYEHRLDTCINLLERLVDDEGEEKRAGSFTLDLRQEADDLISEGDRLLHRLYDEGENSEERESWGKPSFDPEEEDDGGTIDPFDSDDDLLDYESAELTRSLADTIVRLETISDELTIFMEESE